MGMGASYGEALLALRGLRGMEYKRVELMEIPTFHSIGHLRFRIHKV